MRRPKWQDVVAGLQEHRSASGECAAFADVALKQQANSCKVIFLCTEWKQNPKAADLRNVACEFHRVVTSQSQETV